MLTQWVGTELTDGQETPTPCTSKETTNDEHGDVPGSTDEGTTKETQHGAVDEAGSSFSFFHHPAVQDNTQDGASLQVAVSQCSAKANLE
jgi:hypothetical protein